MYYKLRKRENLKRFQIVYCESEQRRKPVQRRSSTTFVFNRRRQETSCRLEKMRRKYRLLQK